MKCEVLFIQGAGTETIAQEEPMVHALHQQLGPDFHIRHPVMPDADEPAYALWKGAIEKEIGAVAGPLILLGHSLGGSVLLKYFSETPVSENIAGLILFGMPFWGAAGWKYKEFELEEDKLQGLQALKGVYIYHSRSDEEVPLEHLDNYIHLLPAAQTRVLTEIDHSYKGAVNTIVEDINELVEAIR